ncbi:unnamed protein product [Parnassius mnemosyne]|uniref:Tyr recombinase domain-containing protein n=1 Tax=Parnassius mnemosyne TaxID=213953 RepID=A0AAV1KXF1_9NEOP
MSLSNTTVQSRILDLSNDILATVIHKIKESPMFALQLDESTGVTSCSQLLIFTVYIKDHHVKEEYLFCKSLATTTHGEDVFETLKQFIEENGVDSSNLVGVYTGGAPSMMGARFGFQALVKQVAPQVLSYHCMIHRYALAFKTLPLDLLSTLSDAVKIVALIFGVVGAFRREELGNITLKDIEAHGKMLLIKIPNTKNKIPRSFVVEGDFLRIMQKYMNQRSQKAKTDRFFQNYQKGKCTAQAIGINKSGNMPKEIATFLSLPDAEYYTGHSFRRTSATLLADSGANLTSLKRLGDWKSDKIAEGYIADSLNNKLETGKKITQSINLKSSPSPSHDNTILKRTFVHLPSLIMIIHQIQFHQLANAIV